MKKIGVTVSAVQHRKLANGHKVRIKNGKGILLINPAKFDILNNNFLRGKAANITLTAEEIMVNRKLNPEFTNKLKTKTKSTVAKVAESVTPFKIPAEAEAEAEAEPEDFKSVSTQLKGSGMHYLARAGIGAFLSNKASEALGNVSGGYIEQNLNKVNKDAKEEQNQQIAKMNDKRGGRMCKVFDKNCNFVSLNALQSKPYEENFQFRNMFPPTFTKHML